MKKAVCISCTHHYRERIEPVERVLQEAGYDCSYITSDFHHVNKAPHKVDMPHCIQLPTLPYRKNLSVQRILSHLRFAQAAMKAVEDLQPELLYVEVPPNALCRAAARYKKKHPETTVILDVFDMWPETFPGGKIKKLLAPVFKIWGSLRDRNLDKADFVVTECDMFRQKLRLAENSRTIWLCAAPLTLEKPQPQLSDDRLELCYLGAINNVISIPDICGLIQTLTAKKPVVLHIIGKGERQEEFIEEAKKAGAEVIFHGPIYEDEKKLEIMNRCHFGLNVMKSSVFVGLTMKSVEYFRFGLPIINNIPGDTKQLVLERGIGVQLEEGCAETLLHFSNDDCLQMRHQVEAVFDEQFKKSVIQTQYHDVLASCCNRK